MGSYPKHQIGHLLYVVGVTTRAMRIFTTVDPLALLTPKISGAALWIMPDSTR
jgi:hypothetical protein